MLHLKENRVVGRIGRGENNPRNSEGDFLRLNDGRILFAFSRYTGNSGNDHAPCDIAAVFSEDNGESFGQDPVILVRAAEYGESNIMSVSLLRMENGDVGLFFILKHADGSSEYILRRSADEAVTFPGPGTSCLPLGYKGYYVINNCRVLRTEGGRIWIPAAYHRVAYACGDSPFRMSYKASSVFFYSDDDGRSWKEAPERLDIPNSGTGLQEPGILELNGGVLYAYFRTDLLCQYEAVSLDGGRRWFGPQPSRFASPPSPMKIVKNPYSGVYCAVWNPIPNYPGRRIADWSGRTPLVISISQNGVDFPPYTAIDDDPESNYAYPALYALDEHTLLLSYMTHSLCNTVIRKLTIEEQ